MAEVLTMPPPSLGDKPPSRGAGRQRPVAAASAVNTVSKLPNLKRMNVVNTDSEENAILTLGLPRLVQLGGAPEEGVQDGMAGRKRRTPSKLKSSSETPTHTPNLQPDSIALSPFVPHEQREMNPEPVPFHPRVFNYFPPINGDLCTHKRTPLKKVTIIGTSLPSIPGKGSHSLTQSPRPAPDTARSSTVIKKFNVPRRHETTWGTEPVQHTKGFIFHTERYQWDGSTPDSLESLPLSHPGHYNYMVGSNPDYELSVGELRGKGLNPGGEPTTSLSQRERLASEMEYVERTKGLRRRGQMTQHREPQHLLLGGKSVVMCERMDIMGEISRLRSMSHVLPTKAKDLYVGRGFKLPENHKLNRGIPTRPVKHYASHYPKGKTDTPPGTAASQGLPEPAEAAALKGDPRWTKTQPDSDLDAVEAVKKATSNTDLSTRDKVPNPLIKVTGNEDEVLNNADLEELTKIFEKLDTDSDGHISYSQVKSQLPADMTVNQEKFVKQVYDLTSSSTFFGKDEFASLSILIKYISLLEDGTRDALETIDTSKLEENVLEYVKAYESADPNNLGKISIDAFKEILSTKLKSTLAEEEISQIVQTTNPKHEESLQKLKFIAHIPYFMSITGVTSSKEG